MPLVDVTCFTKKEKNGCNIPDSGYVMLINKHNTSSSAQRATKAKKNWKVCDLQQQVYKIGMKDS